MLEKVFIVRGENGGEPESYTLGVYTTEEMAHARVNEIQTDEDGGFEYIWIDGVPLDEPIFVSNR